MSTPIPTWFPQAVLIGGAFLFLTLLSRRGWLYTLAGLLTMLIGLAVLGGIKDPSVWDSIGGSAELKPFGIGLVVLLLLGTAYQLVPLALMALVIGLFVSILPEVMRMGVAGAAVVGLLIIGVGALFRRG